MSRASPLLRPSQDGAAPGLPVPAVGTARRASGMLPLPDVPASHLWTAREAAVVRSRQGSVLNRGLILKADHFAGARRPHLDLHLQGAPNFRKADVPLEVYGCAQPTVTGLKGVLSVLQCQPLSRSAAAASRDSSASGQARRPSGQTLFRSAVDHAASRDTSPSPDPGTPPAPEAPAEASSAPSAQERLAAEPRRPSGRHLGVATDDVGPARKCVWFCTREEPVVYVSNRPFVLREIEKPMETYSISDRAENLESIETRLKQDLLREAARYDGLLMVHEEDEKGQLMPVWVAIDADSVSTIREVFHKARKDGWSVDYHRVPIAADQSTAENNYLDAYLRILKELDPTKTSVVANCGIGAVRTTVAMCAAVIVRRRQMIVKGFDPLPVSQRLMDRPVSDLKRSAEAADSSTSARRGTSPAPGKGIAKSLRAASEQHQTAQTLLRLMRLLTSSVDAATSVDSQAVLEQLLGNPAVLESLQRAYRGDYGIVRQLCSLLEEGLESKAVADLAIDACSSVVHLREMVLSERVAYALAKHGPGAGSTDAYGDSAAEHLGRAVRTLEQYASLIIFAEYAGGSETAAFGHRFSTYLKGRPEVWGTVLRVRSKGSQLYLFAPVEDLSVLSRPSSSMSEVGQLMGGSRRGFESRADPEQPGDEFAEHIVRNRAGVVLRPMMLLKQDIWRKFIERDRQTAGTANVRGAVNLRRVPNSNIWVTGQPTKQGLVGIVRSIQQQLGDAAGARQGTLEVTWLTLREEPLIVVAGKPVVLRQKGSSLRNVREFGGISWDRLKLLEEKLKADVLSELEAGENKLLLHAELDDGEVVPRWEEIQPSEVQTLQEVMTDATHELAQPLSAAEGGAKGVKLSYRRIPLTAERPPHPDDFDEIMRLVIKAKLSDNALVLNDQLGRGRGTLTAVIVLLIVRWLDRHRQAAATAAAVTPAAELKDESVPHVQREALSYHAVNALLRIIPHGLDVKASVDDAINQCASSAINLRDIIEDTRLAAEDLDDEAQRQAKVQAAMHHLRRYYELCIFQAYLNATSLDTLDTLPTFESFIKRQPVLETLSQEFEKVDMATITPLQKLDAEGAALDEEVQAVVASRSGSVLSAFTMLKSDMFPGLAKISLSQIEGLPNLRGVPLVLGADSQSGPAALRTWGHGMPSIEGLRRGLEYMDAGPDGKARVVASSMREEPVLFINGRPHVLRLADQPLTNVEATGITKDVVESMEQSLKEDVLKELRKYDGRLLLHDEIELSGGRYEIVPQWFPVRDDDVLTPRDVYETIQREGYRVDYARIPVTDEQAPVPAVFSELEERVQLALRTNAAPISNCQMGRGRTTTSMVISILVATVMEHAEELLQEEMHASFIAGPGADDEDDTTDGLMARAKDKMDNREDDLQLAGEYRSILQLCGVLAHGKLAKRLADKAIDACDQVQNLRKAIFDAKLRAENADPGTKKHTHLSRVYNNYLQRYGYLIVFTSYLLDKVAAQSDGAQAAADEDDTRSVASRASTAQTTGRFPSFLSYLQPRREIQAILGRRLE